jgi:hypothetical protein
MSMIKIEWLETVKIGTGVKLKETTDFVSADEYRVYVTENGWAKNCDTGETGTRTPGAKKININSITTTLG